MIAAVPTIATGAMVSLLLGAAVASFARAVNGGHAGGHAMGGSAIGRSAARRPTIASRRSIVALAVGIVVLLATGWVLLAAFTGGLVATWGRVLRDDRAADERVRVEGIAKWLEDLRDTLRGSSVGAEEALEQVSLRPPDAIADELRAFVHRRRLGFRTEDALADLADDLAHPTADAAIAAIRLVVGGSAGAGRLHATVSALATAARDEVTARERIDRTRTIYQSSMKRLVLIGGLLVGYLRFAGGDLLDPYGTAVGQMVLALPLAMWLGCILWLRSLCAYEAPERYRIAGSVAPVNATGGVVP